MDKLNIRKQLIELILRNESFAFWQHPNEEIKIMIGQWQEINSLTEIINKNGFYVQSFDNSKKYFLNNHSGKANKILFTEENNHQQSQEEYMSICQDYINKIKSGQFNKLVLSRTFELTDVCAEDIADVYLRACEIYKTAFVYILNIPNYAIWAGASPEILVKTKNNILTTVALAGTKKNENNTSPHWQQKEIEEQELVSIYIREALNKSGLNSFSEGEKQTVEAGNLLHIKTIFNATFQNTTQLINAIENLHPTPAVCGLPKQHAYNYILNTETHKREFYTGFIGPIHNNEINFYVNIRCLKYRQQTTTFYAGGGITTLSNPTKEWEETENKINTLRELLNHKND